WPTTPERHGRRLDPAYPGRVKTLVVAKNNLSDQHFTGARRMLIAAFNRVDRNAQYGRLRKRWHPRRHATTGSRRKARARAFRPQGSQQVRHSAALFLELGQGAVDRGTTEVVDRQV